MSLALVSLVALLYVALLFWIARRAEVLYHHPDKYPRLKPWAYSLSLGVYCTSWTYYGAVGSAAGQGWNYLPILIGPVLLWAACFGLLTKLVTVSKRQNVSSIADLLSSRYGKRQRVAVAVTLLVLLATIPYIALQLKAVTLSFNVITGQDPETPIFVQEQASLIVTILMAFFALAFGTRKIDVTEYQPGVVLAVAFESLVKLLALLFAAILALSWFEGLPQFLVAMERHPQLQTTFAFDGLSANFITQLLLSFVAAICLPRQFFLGVVQQQTGRDMRLARWVFPAYLLAIAVLIVPIAATGIVVFQNADMNPDTYVLQLPLQAGADWTALLIFIGGFSASTAMIIVATITLGTMISNDVVLPLLIRRRYRRDAGKQDFSDILLTIRRFSVVGVLIGAFFYHLAFTDFAALTSIGLLSFALVVQLAPALLGGLYWKGGHSQGAMWGLAAGVGLWFYTLMLPTLVEGGMLTPRFLAEGPGGISWLRPEALLGVEGMDRLTHGVVFSLLFNALFYVLVSSYSRTRLVDRIQASAYVNPVTEESNTKASGIRPSPLRTLDLRTLLEQFLGRSRTYQILHDFSDRQGLALDDEASPDFALIEYCERILAGAIGTASARAMMNSLLEGKSLGLEDIVTFFDETAQALQQNQSVLNASLENIEQGLCVLDKDLRLLAWNRPYARLFNYPPGRLQVGTPVAELIRLNAERGLCGPGEAEEHVQKRLDHMRRGTPHRFQRWRPDGSVIEMWGNPLPDGGFVTTFTDITEHTRDKQALREAKETLEKRVEQRTETISQMNVELLREIDHRRSVEREVRKAQDIAESANAAKTRFLALASHDILQPLNAARLYASALQENPDSDDRDTLIANLSQSLNSTESLIATLLEIARLDDGAIVPHPEVFDIADILQPVTNEFRTLAEATGVRVRSVLSHARVHTDKLYLRRIIQNLVSNAVKYAEGGQVLLGCRRQGGQLILQVWDTGSGIPAEQQSSIFEDFFRLQQHQHHISGAGLGLGVVARLTRLLGIRVTLESQPDTFTCFSLRIPLAGPDLSPENTGETPEKVRTPVTRDGHELAGLRVLCVDDEAANLDALQRLLGKWQCRIHTASGVAEAMRWAEHEGAPDVLLMDYHLHDEIDGVALIEKLSQVWGCEVPSAILTASHEAEVLNQVRAAGYQLLHKPLKPAALKALLRHFRSLS